MHNPAAQQPSAQGGAKPAAAPSAKQPGVSGGAKPVPAPSAKPPSVSAKPAPAAQQPSAQGGAKPAAAALGPAACWLTTGLSLAAVWTTALAAAQGWYEPWISFQPSDLTFTAPFYSLLFVLTAIILTTARLQAE